MFVTRHVSTAIRCCISRRFQLTFPITVRRDLSTSLTRLSPDSSKSPPNHHINDNEKQSEHTQDTQHIHNTSSANATPANSSRSPTDEFLEKLKPHLDSAHHYYDVTKNQLSSAIAIMKHHTANVKKAIRTANEKFEQQEKESANYGFNEDFTSKDAEELDKKKIVGLPSERERKRKRWAKKLELYLDSLQETIFTATRALNDVTGYSSIQKLRESIDALEAELENSKKQVKLTKENYNEAISQRLETQKEVNELLQRKSSWSPTDLERFTKLYKEDHTNALNEEKAKDDMEQAETHQEELYDKLSNAILTRYHEEQIWSDKIRRTSTWGTFGLMGINIFLFLILQMALEPWKRKRLVGNFEEKVQKALEESQNQQNQRLDLMSEKMEALKNSDSFPALEESAEPEVTDDAELMIVVPPQIEALPLVLPGGWWTQVGSWIKAAVEPLKSPYNLLFSNAFERITINKTDMVSTVSLAIAFGAVAGSCLTAIFR